jgi:hypothetical protein
MKRVIMMSLMCLGIFSASGALACGIEGKAVRTDGSKVDGTARVSTSWNSKEAYPHGGYYNLDLGDSVCGENIEVYVNGNSIGRRKIPNDGNARVDFTLKGSTNMPVN